jgi:hypothetical protein
MKGPNPLRKAALEWALLHWLPQPDRPVNPPDELTRYAEGQPTPAQGQEGTDSGDQQDTPISN